MPRRPALPPAPRLLPLLLLGMAAGTSQAYFADWGVIGGRPQEPTCVDIPESMPLCSGIDYTKMRLPNLLEHDTLKEAQQQANYWVPLLNLQCHPDTQLFLCSLFTPVCLESPIYPCRSLCEAVRSGCEGRMQTYSFPWPDMLRCDKFPLDNDMCITVQHSKVPGPEIVQDGECEACGPVETYENILDNFCRADVVVKTRISKQRKGQLVCKRARAYKSSDTEEERRALRRPRFALTDEASCCTLTPSRTRYLVMARRQGQDLIPTFIMPFKKSRPLRKAVKKFADLDCSDPKLITGGPEVPTLSQEPPQRGTRRRRPKNGRKRPKGGRKGRKKVQGEGSPTNHSEIIDEIPVINTHVPAAAPPPTSIDDESLQFLHEDVTEDTTPSVLPPRAGRGGRKRERGQHGRRQRNKSKKEGRRKKKEEQQTEEPTPEP